MPQNPRVSGSKGLVTTDHPASSLAAVKVFKKGGNAADAAVAAAAALAVVDPSMGGVSGYGYLTYYDAAEDRVFCLDFIGVAPAAARIEMYDGEKPWEDYKPNSEGILAFMVPGAVAGWQAILDRFGNLKMRDALAPAIELARGYAVSEFISNYYEALKFRAARFPKTAEIFYKNGSFPKPGEAFVQKDLARTLEAIAEEGAGVFYNGSIAKSIAKYVQRAGGIVTEEDLASYETKWRDPVSGKYADCEVYSHPPGSSGITILQWLNILEGFEFKKTRWDSAEFVHLFLEAGKLALRDDDMYNTGKDYAKIPVGRLISKRYAANQRAKIDVKKPRFYELVSTPKSYGKGTSHHCTCDGNGNVATLTQTQMLGFDRVGIVGDLGFNLNGGMSYFRLDPKNIERVEPRQRPRYVMSPTIAFKDNKVIGVGCAGGWTIPQTITLVLMKLLEFEMPIEEAVSSPRFVSRYRYNSIPYAPGTVADLEDGIPDATRRRLLRKGHKVTETPLIAQVLKLSDPSKPYVKQIVRDLFPSFGLSHAVMYEEGRLSAGTEARRDGYVAVL